MVLVIIGHNHITSNMMIIRCACTDQEDICAAIFCYTFAPLCERVQSQGAGRVTTVSGNHSLPDCKDEVSRTK